ncbi:MAG: hypothetical protein HUJ70_06825 [Pseudobutyrivibrio sp.]|nr:hypothetical protein [Pseudobutyrivibrio sp.]
MASYKVGDYTFYDEPTAKKAAGELKAIEYMLPQLEKAKDKEVLKAYNQLIQRRMFTTAVGMSFLQQLRNRLLTTRGINKSEILPLYDLESGEDSQKPENTNNTKKAVDKQKAVATKTRKQNKKNRKPEKKISLQEENRRLKAANSILLTISLALMIVVVGMFYVSSTINSPNILNYEEFIINKYASWQQDLEEKELELLERERALDNL